MSDRSGGAEKGEARAEMVIPADRLPAGFADGLDRPPANPAVPRPAATAVLVRDGDEGPEALLLRRHRASGFVPGAWVFPGGRVDDADGDDALRGLCDSALPEEPDAAYWMAAVREVFEETGVLLAARRPGDVPPDSSADGVLSDWREALLADRATLLDVLRGTERRLDPAALVYIAHWITPAPEPRRYDTRFFLAALPEGATSSADAREMTDERWLRPSAALDAFRAGGMPMVFPTVRTLEQLAGFASVGAMLRAFRGRPVPAIEPRLVRTRDGVGIVVDD